MNAPAEMIEAALADAANRSTTARTDITVVSAEAVTWPDGSLGCPQPGMMYTQALVSGYRIVLQAGDTVLNYHSAARGRPVFCPASRVSAPVGAGVDSAI
jgi:hypothetical protein